MLRTGKGDLVARNRDLAPAQIQFRCLPTIVGKVVGVEGIDHEATLLLLLDQTRRLQHSQMMGHIHNLYVEQIGQFRNILGTRPQTFDNPNPIRFSDRLKQFGTLINLRLSLMPFETLEEGKKETSFGCRTILDNPILDHTC